MLMSGPLFSRKAEAGLTANAPDGKNKIQHITMKSLIRIYDALDCDCEPNDAAELVKAET